jgi:cytochrome c biogenesis protein
VTATQDEDTRRSPQGFGDVPDAPMRAMQRLGGWKMLRSMRTAIWLLIALGVATLIPTFIPQRITNEAKVLEYAEGNSFWYQVAERLQLFDVFSAPWYVAIYGALLFVLLMCLIPRTRAYVQQWRRAVARPRTGLPPRVPFEESWTTDVAPDDAARIVRATLRRKWFRCGTANDDGQWVAEKGASREGGSLVFHWSFFVLMLGLAISANLGYRGFATIIEGQRWTDTPIAIDRYDPPALFADSAHPGFTVQLDEFYVGFLDNGVPSDFISKVRVLEDGREVFRKDVGVNSPLQWKGVKLHQTSFGWAARVVVRSPDGAELTDRWIALRPSGPRNSWTGAVKLDGNGDDTALQFYLLPTAVVLTRAQAVQFRDELGDRVLLAGRPGPPTADSPAMLFRNWKGDLRLDQPQDVNSVNTDGLTLTDVGVTRLADPAFTMNDGLRVEFPELRQYSVFQVKKDPGIPVIALAAVLILGGLVPSLYVYRRRLWVWVRPTPETTGDGDSDGLGGGRGSVITLGGIAYQRKEAFPDEFAGLVDVLRSACPPAAEREPDGVPTDGGRNDG